MEGLELTAGEVPGESLYWALDISPDKTRWEARGWLEVNRIFRDAEGEAEDYEPIGAVPVFHATGFGSPEIARTWAEAMVGGPVSWDRPDHRYMRVRGFRDVTAEGTQKY